MARPTTLWMTNLLVQGSQLVYLTAGKVLAIGAARCYPCQSARCLLTAEPIFEAHSHCTSHAMKRLISSHLADCTSWTDPVDIIGSAVEIVPEDALTQGNFVNCSLTGVDAVEIWRGRSGGLSSTDEAQARFEGCTIQGGDSDVHFDDRGQKRSDEFGFGTVYTDLQLTSLSVTYYPPEPRAPGDQSGRSTVSEQGMPPALQQLRILPLAKAPATMPAPNDPAFTTFKQV